MASCLLLTLLPPELRRNIYNDILVRADQPVEPGRSLSLSAEHESRTAILQTCRQIYDEAYPVLLSANTWKIRPGREDHTWLIGLGLQGQNTLRKIILQSPHSYHGIGPESFYFEMSNTLPSYERLELTIKSSTGQLSSHYSAGTLKYMHGFAKATMDELSNEQFSCSDHGNLSGVWHMDLMAQRDRTWKALLDQLMSACPEDCEMHVGRPTSHTKSTVHLSLLSTCFYCQQRFR